MDKTLICKDCGKDFIFTEREQEFYASKNFGEPVRCFDCRKAKKARKEANENGQREFVRYEVPSGEYRKSGRNWSRGQR